MTLLVAIIGSRKWPPAELIRVGEYVQRLAVKHPHAIVVSGGARGVDRTAEKAARLNGLELISFRPYKYDSIDGHPEYSIETYTEGERAQEIVVEHHYRINAPFFRTYAQAAHHRNGWIVELAHHIVSFWDGKSTGTNDSLRKARKLGKPVHLQLLRVTA